MGSISDVDPPVWRLVLVMIGGITIHLSLGTVYTYGNFAPYLVSYMRDRKVAPDLRYNEALWIFAMMTLGQGVSGFLGGVLERLIGPRLTTLLGSWIMSAGVLLSYFTVNHSFTTCLITYGLIFGFGLGIAYPIPMGCAMRWMPHRKGFVVGFVVGGFGGAAFIFNQVITAYINPNNLNPDIESNGEQYFSQAEVLDRVPICFLILGGTFAVMQLIGSLLICDPPILVKDDERRKSRVNAADVEGIDNNGCNNEMETVAGAIQERRNTGTSMTSEIRYSISKEIDRRKSRCSVMTIREGTKPLDMLKTKAFYILWFLFVADGQSMVFISTLYKAYGQTFIKDDQFLSLVGAFASLCNAAGRILWGAIADRTSFKTAQLAITTILTCLFATLNLSELGGKPVFFIWICLIFLTFSGSFSTFPSCMMRCFGEQYYSINYGLLFTSQAITAIIGSLLSEHLLVLIGWHGLFFVAAGISICATVIAFLFEEPNF